MTTDLTERGLERLMCRALAGNPCDPPAGPTTGEPLQAAGGCGWACGNSYDYNREHCLDLVQLRAFLNATQPDAAPALQLGEDSPTRRKFCVRLQGEISKRGTIDVLRRGIRHGAHNLELFYGTPSARNEAAQQRFRQNRFSVTRQLRYSHNNA